jgi:hypothetical protein
LTAEDGILTAESAEKINGHFSAVSATSAVKKRRLPE